MARVADGPRLAEARGSLERDRALRVAAVSQLTERRATLVST